MTPNSDFPIKREGGRVDSRNSEEDIAKVALDFAKPILTSLVPETKQSVTHTRAKYVQNRRASGQSLFSMVGITGGNANCSFKKPYEV